MRPWHAVRRRVAEVMGADPNVQGSVSFSSESNVGYAFSHHETAQASESSPWIRPLPNCGPRWSRVPGIMTFLQNPPPITISGQFTTSVYQMTLQSVNLKEIYDWTPKLTHKIRTLPGFVDVNSDL